MTLKYELHELKANYTNQKKSVDLLDSRNSFFSVIRFKFVKFVFLY